MSYDATIPAAANTVRGASGDLIKIKQNFVTLHPVATSGMHGLISGGSAVSGSVPVTVAAGASAAFQYRTLVIGNLNNVSVAGAASGSVLILSGTTWVDRLLKLVNLLDVVGGGSATSGQVLVSNGAGSWSPADQSGGGGGGGGGGSGVVPSKRVTLAMLSGATISAANGVNTQVTGMVSIENSGTIAVDLASGDIFVPSGITHMRLHGSLRWASNSVGSRRVFFRFGESKDTRYKEITNSPAYFGFNAPNSSTVSIQQITTPWLPIVSANQRISLAGHQDSGGALNIEWGFPGATSGAAYGTMLTAEFGNIPTGIVDEGWQGVFTFASGAVQVIPTASFQTASGIVVTQRDSGGFTVSSGVVTVPTGSGYTHVDIEAQVTWQQNSTGVRELFVVKDDDAAFIIRDTSGNPYSAAYQRVQATTVAGRDPCLRLNIGMIPVSGGDNFRLKVYQDSGGSIQLRGGGGPEGAQCMINIRGYKIA